MTSAAAASPETGKSRFALPSAYTILFILIVLVALLTWIIPAGTYDTNSDGDADPGLVPHGRRRTRSGSSSTR